MKNFLAIPFGLLILLQATVTSPTPIPQVSGHDEKGGDVTRGPDAQINFLVARVDVTTIRDDVVLGVEKSS
ncbi:hypothetical protein PtA15_10A556 [Puccinia triticina]|uniref:Uncharacterized protein n=1 Tax=Puccinia triticina TaxID=208348 RepID=A0ABY7CYQ3_9BASI|nr:uncharacterized protein PtA15_10A556 [Puccinia triticina]WAQ89132.1 hypothetical protein PtA15_10A556 [Puccinia triticina]